MDLHLLDLIMDLLPQDMDLQVIMILMLTNNDADFVFLIGPGKNLNIISIIGNVVYFILENFVRSVFSNLVGGVMNLELLFGPILGDTIGNIIGDIGFSIITEIGKFLLDIDILSKLTFAMGLFPMFVLSFSIRL